MNAEPQKTLLIAGASGVIGAGAVAHFAHLPGWQVIALSRRAPLVTADCAFTHISVDLTNAAACADAVAAMPPVTHLIYAAVAEAPGLVGGWRDPQIMALNGAMFENLLRPLATFGRLQHVNLLQGTKAYGMHVHAVTLPLREDGPRDPHDNFYWLHEDALRASATAAGYNFTIWRPQVLVGIAPGVAMNPVLPIAAYAAICRKRGLPFALPGISAALLELVDTSLLAEAMAWAANDPAARNQIFNITNGDQFVLRYAWDRLASAVGLETKGEAPTDFVSFFADKANQQTWAEIADRHELIESSLSDLLGQSHHYLDLLNSARVAKSTPALLSTIKLRQAGFAGCRDSQRALIAQIQRMSELRLMPPLVA